MCSKNKRRGATRDDSVRYGTQTIFMSQKELHELYCNKEARNKNPKKKAYTHAHNTRR